VEYLDNPLLIGCRLYPNAITLNKFTANTLFIQFLDALLSPSPNRDAAVITDMMMLCGGEQEIDALSTLVLNCQSTESQKVLQHFLTFHPPANNGSEYKTAFAMAVKRKIYNFPILPMLLDYGCDVNGV